MNMKWMSITHFALLLGVFFSADAYLWNSPHEKLTDQATFYTAIVGSPKTLDPARSFAADEAEILAQIVEPVLQYDYLKRPYQLVPLTARFMPVVTYYDQNNQRITSPLSKKIAYTVYDITIQPQIDYQPHPAFAKNAAGDFLYHHLTPQQIRSVYTLSDFKETGTRELTAEDYVYEIKRLAFPAVQSPIFGVMSKYIVGFEDFGKPWRGKDVSQHFVDLRDYDLEGAKVIDRYHYQIKIHGAYPQFKYWLAMLFFVPVPWEADAFYSQPGLEKHDISFSWYPVGTGPYRLTENNPNKQMVLTKNPNFHQEYYPTTGMPGDAEKGYLQDAGKRLPFIDKVVFELDKESLPRWNKFLQGYYDRSGVGADSFDQAIKINENGKVSLTNDMKEKGIQLRMTVEPGIYYMGFNMKDPVVGGYSEQKQKLRQAIAIALDYEEYISIFLNGRGIPAEGPIPRGIFGYQPGRQGMNPYVYDWVNGKAKRKSIVEAKKLLAQAGYPGGIDPHTGRALILNYDTATLGNPDDKSYFDWLRKQFARLGIQLNIRATLYNQFQDQVLQGKVQIFSWGWIADYPDPEDFLFLLYGPNGKVDYGGENSSNYSNPVVDQLFLEIRQLPDGMERQKKINALVEIVRKDSPWIWGFNPVDFVLSHQWNANTKPNAMARNSLKYMRVNAALRLQLQKEWNQPKIFPLIIFGVFVLVLIVLIVIAYRARENKPSIKKITKKELP